MKKFLLTFLLLSVFSIPHLHGSDRKIIPCRLLFTIPVCFILFIGINLFAGSDKIIRSEKQNEKQRSKIRLANSNHYVTSKLTKGSKQKLLQNIQRIMENPDEFCNCEFTLNRLSMLVNSNSSYVSQVINETYNKNFRAFINDYRIREAQHRLMDTERYGNYTIQAIAESVGYKSHANFILIFKRKTGMNPSVFQKIAKGKE